MDTGTPLETWKLVQDRTKEALKAHFPIETKNRALILHDVHIDEDHPAPRGEVRAVGRDVDPVALEREA